MATAEQMAAYTAHLRTHTSAQNKPVTEICIFKLRAPYTQDHTAALSTFESQIAANTAPGNGKPNAPGIRRIAYGFSVDDPGTFVWMLDWDKIQDHWEFWQKEAFPPVIGAITELFVEGRPLVRHYDFGEEGMLDGGFRVARVVVWDDGKGRARESGNKSLARVRQVREAYAVDMDEMTWWCSLLGYESEEDCRADGGDVMAGEGAENHIVRLQYK
ncbi:uncharacterized protein BDW47DRAFT_122799 [Aspergillus candidus]|uniref:ABM domain-containing protein n=1 Tax=Aspergillus candidus TaxID=41067 RepID=A0A2I2FKT7_ASPCN|nr:hypothetical protein BDW47DRAFT_122799 [Aspergillus candidus]PLB41236.1 hypothetical protein BDW47DRAFT_122799 [Aspergillus candidus]